MVYRAEYIWIDGQQPTAKLRSKTKIVADGEEPPIWGFDGSSTEQAVGSSSDCVLRPVRVVPDPIRGGDNKLVMTEVLNTDMTPHVSNTRARCAEVAEKFASFEPWFGIEQEYTFFKAGRRVASRRRKVATTAVSVRTRSGAATWSRLTPPTASTPGSPSPARMQKS